MSYRIRDIVVAILVMLLGGWLFVLIALALWVTQGQVFYVQERTGWRGKPFRMVKFSTLYDAAPGTKEEDAQRYRLTPMGKILRRLSLDEFPQIWHVLTGEMSLVGPRPLIHEYWPLYSEIQKRRFEVRPGITGWAQVNGRNLLSFTERFKLDVWYVEHRSWILDLKIMWRTASQALGGRGVYASAETTMAKFDGRN